jgi:hypothetical protein
MRHPAQREGVAQRAHHRLLPDQVIEHRGAVFARQHAIGGGGERRHRGGSGLDLAEQPGACRFRRRQLVVFI